MPAGNYGYWSLKTRIGDNQLSECGRCISQTAALRGKNSARGTRQPEGSPRLARRAARRRPRKTGLARGPGRKQAQAREDRGDRDLPARPRRGRAKKEEQGSYGAPSRAGTRRASPNGLTSARGREGAGSSPSPQGVLAWRGRHGVINARARKHNAWYEAAFLCCDWTSRAAGGTFPGPYCLEREGGRERGGRERNS